MEVGGRLGGGTGVPLSLTIVRSGERRGEERPEDRPDQISNSLYPELVRSHLSQQPIDWLPALSLSYFNPSLGLSYRIEKLISNIIFEMHLGKTYHPMGPASLVWK